MLLQFVQTGGFVGLVKGCEIDTATLPPELAGQVELLVDASRRAASGELLSDSGRDLQQYDITIEEEGGTKISVTLDDESVPEPAKPLIGYLKRCSKPKALE